MLRRRRILRRFISLILSRRHRPRSLKRPRFRRVSRLQARQLNGPRLIELGRKPYREVLALQREIHGQVARGQASDTWIVVEHEPVITLGRKAKRENLLVPEETLTAAGMDIVEVERGGDITYHGPGQVVVYPIVKLRRFREVVPFVSALEDAVVDALGDFGIAAHGQSEHRGVYVGRNAICALGLAVKQMTTLHGLALNVSVDLDYDRLVTPCGTPNFGVTSISRQLKRDVPWNVGRDAILKALQRRFEIQLVHESEPAI